LYHSLTLTSISMLSDRIWRISIGFLWFLTKAQSWVVLLQGHKLLSVKNNRDHSFPFSELLHSQRHGNELRMTSERLGDDVDFGNLMDMDVVLYQQQDAEVEDKPVLGAVQEDGSIAPLSAWTDEAAFGNSVEFVVDEEDRFPGVQEEDVRLIKVLPEEVIGYGSRQVNGGKGPGNPHGEESELVYYVDQEAIKNIEFPIKPSLEHTW